MTNANKKQDEVLPAIRRAGFQRANVTGCFWVAVIPNDHTIDDVLCPEYWAHIADSTFMGIYNEITCVWEDKMEVAKLFVRDYTDVSAAVEVMFHEDYRNKEVKQLDRVERYTIAWSDPKRKHVITDSTTGMVVKEGVQAKKDAEKFVEDLISK